MEAIADQPGAPERTNPFPGLRPFEPDEDHLFFGRERETDELLRRLRTHRFVSVLGTSGSGKSSLVRSGLIPSLHSGFMVTAGSSWRVAILRPGDNPIGNLADALDAPDVLGGDPDIAETQRMLLETSLRRSDLGLADCVRHARLPAHENVVIVVDQFEELFRFRERREAHGARDEAVAFAKLLLGAANQDEVPVYVVLTMRSDFIGDCMEYPGLPEAINRGQYLIPRMTRDELRAAITGPVAVGGGEIAPRLVSRLLNEVGDDPDQLPVLQHAMMRSWDHWLDVRADDEPLDLQHYDAIGTMADALSQHAEEAYAELPSARAREITERLFKALTDTRLDDRGVRRPTAVDEVAAITAAAGTEVIEVVNVFRKPGRSFLMPPAGVELGAESILDLSHESLMRNWTRLVGWVDEETVSGKAYRRLCRSARRHANREGALWSDPELAIGLKWREENKPNEAWASRYDPSFADAMRFLDESRAAEQARVQAEENERRAKLRRARIVTGIVSAAAVVALIFGLIAVRAGRIARQAQQVATREAQTARAVSDFLVELFEVADPDVAQGSAITAEEILDEGARKIDSDLSAQPEVQARLMRTIGRTYASLGLYDQAGPLLERATETSSALLGAEAPETLAALHQLAELRWDQGRLAAAEEIYTRVLEERRAALGEQDPATLVTLRDLGGVYNSLGRYARAEETGRQAHEAMNRDLGPKHPDTLESGYRLAAALVSLGRYGEAEPLYEQIWETQRQVLGDQHPDTMLSMAGLAGLYVTLARYDEAEHLWDDNLDRHRRVYGDEHPKTLMARFQRAQLDSDRGRWREAERVFEEVLEARRRVLGEEHPAVVQVMHNLSWAYYSRARNEEAEALARQAYETGLQALGKEHPQTRFSANNLAAVSHALGRHEIAEELWGEALEMDVRRLGEAHPEALNSRNNLAAVYGNTGRLDRGEELMQETLEISRSSLGEESPQTIFYMNNVVANYFSQGRLDQAEELGLQALALARQVLGNNHPTTLKSMSVLAYTYCLQLRFEDCEVLGLEALEGSRVVFGDDHPNVVFIVDAFANLYTSLGRYDEALANRMKVLESRRRVFGEDHPETIGAYDALAGYYEQSSDPGKALELRRKALDLRRRLASEDGAGAHDKHRFSVQLVNAQRELQSPDEAVGLGLEANELTGYRNKDYVANLAEAYFRAGRTSDAIEAQRRAIDLVSADDTDARSRLEGRLATFREASGDRAVKREATIEDLARSREAAEKPGASPRVRNDFAWKLLTAAPSDLQEPEEALRVAASVAEETGHKDVAYLATLALAYYKLERTTQAVETQQALLARLPEESIQERYTNELRLQIYRGDGRREFKPDQLVGAWSAAVGSRQFRIEFLREGEYLVGWNRLVMRGRPADTRWVRFRLADGEFEVQQSDPGFANPRWEPGEYRFVESDRLIGWAESNMEPLLFEKE